MYIGIDGQNKAIDKAYIAVDGQNKEIDKMYISVDGQNKEFYSSEPQEDFSFVIYGNQYIVDYLTGEALNFTIDWGDGTQTAVNSTDVAQRTHTYPSEQEWTIKIKKYVSGWIQFYHSATTAQRAKLRRVLTPFPTSETRTSFSICFYLCTSLATIPTELFANNPNVTDFSSCFRECLITTIPAELFANNSNAINFAQCFYGCTSLATIPAGLFANNPNVISFGFCFYGCTSLATIPAGLFANNQNVTTFFECFLSCTSLATIPANLFANNPKVTNFNSCFNGCNKLTDINITIHPDVLARNTNYARMFFVSSVTYSHTGLAPELWKSATTTASYKTACFWNNTALTNYANIPAEWK